MKYKSTSCANHIWYVITLSFISFFVFDTSSIAQGTASGVPTFHCIGIYWSGSGGNSGTVCNVQYRVAGSGTWKNGFPLVFDNRSIGGRPSNEYRGSLVNLTPGTNYEIQLTAGSATKTFTAATWSENFPVGSTTTLNSPTTISTSGSPTAYRVYTGSISGGSNNITVDASYIIIRNMTLTGAAQDAIVLDQNAHHVVIEGCDISGWGQIGMESNNQGAVRIKGFSYNASNVKQIIVQRNKLHDSRENSNSWDDGGHPLGPNAITFDESGGNHVIRYNEIYTSSASKKFMDGIGGGDNFTFTGAPGANSDIYANKIEDVYDDAIESEGGNCNVRIWGNWMDNTFTGIATAANSVGPMYIWNNVSNVSVRSPSEASSGTIDNEDRGPFNKCGSPDDTYSGGRTFLFHNTILQPVQSGFSYSRGMAGGPMDNGGAIQNVYSRNNIWQTYRSGYPSIGEYQSSSNSGNTYDYDLYNGSLNIAASGSHESSGVSGTPTYAAGMPLTGPNPSGYFLASGSKGVDKGQALNNFNDGYTGSAPDIGAYETGRPALQFGVNAYLISTPPANQPPVANAGNDITITLPIVITTLNGSGSDPDGTISSYSWSRVSGPTIFSLGSATSAITTLLGLVQGTYVFRLTVTDNNGATASDDVTVTVNPLINLPPIANAGPDRTLTLPANSTTLSGSGTDVGGTISSYAWIRISGPSTFSLGNANAATTALNNLVQGIYVFRLTVTDNNGATATDDVTVTVNAAPNQPPTANAGTDKTITLPINTTTLTGSGYDTEGTIASYAWTRVSGPTTYTFGTANAATTTVNGMVQGTYVFSLTVTDNNGATAFDDVTVTVNAANQPPTANAGTDKTITLPINTTTLTGSGYDTDGTIASYAWTRVSGPTPYTFGSANAATTTVNGMVQGLYVFRLTVTDNNGATATDDVTVTVNAAPNQPPTANAGTDKTITLPINTTTLTGTGYDTDGTIASYAWTRVSGPTTYTFGSANTATTTVNGMVEGTYVFRFTVIDNNGATAFDDVTVTVNAAPNQPPTANAGTDETITLPTNSITLTGSGTDPDGTISSYAWTLISGPTTYTFDNANAATTTVNGMVQGTYVFRLTVIDNNGATASDDVTVIVNAIPNTPPSVNAGFDRTLNLPTNSTTLMGSGTDADGTVTSFAWTTISGPTNYTIVSPGAYRTSVGNLVQGVYVFRLTATDNNGATASDDVTISVISATNTPPTAYAGVDQTITLPTSSTTLVGNGADTNGTITGYEWSRVSGPTSYTLDSANAAITIANSLVQGTYVFRLTVTDNNGATGTDDVTVTVNAAPPPPPTLNVGTASGVSTFESIGLYWSGSGGSSSTTGNVKYRIAGSGAAWKDGYPLWFDSRAVGDRPANEYRGSLTGLQPATAYEIQLIAGSATNTFNVSTWSENFPIGETQTVSNSSSTLNITTSGSASGYRLYIPAAGQTATINVNNAATNCIYINASYVIIRGLTLRDAREDAILLGPDAHDVVIENNDISGWGQTDMGENNQAGVRAKGGSGSSNIVRIIIQRNKIHESRANSNSWDNGGHPLGPNGINFDNSGGNHVFRYNDIYGNATHYFMDGIGGGSNFSFEGSPNANSDIYGNKISQVYDDAIEAEGANCNVRIWGNFINNVYTGIATASTSVGPVYIFRNVTNVMQRSSNGASASTIDNEDRGPFNKGGGDDSTYVGGRTYLFHNTTLQPVESGYSYPRGADCGPADYGGPVTNVISRNNIWQSFKSNHASIVEWENASNGNNYDYDLYNGWLMINSSGTHEGNGINGTPTYASEVPLTLNPAGYFLTSTSKGVDTGLVLQGFSDGYTGSKPDMGAYESGRPALQFGVDAYLNNSENLKIQSEPALTSLSTVTETVAVSGKTSPGLVSSSFVAYPNPASAELSLLYRANANGKFSISVFDINSKLIWKETVVKDGPSLTKTINVSNYAQGVYVIQIVSPDNKEKMVTKFVKI